MVEVGVGASWGVHTLWPEPGVTLDTISVTEQSTGLTYRAAPAYTQNSTDPKTVRASASYVTGSHFAKFGISERFGRNIAVSNTDQEMTYRFQNGSVPRARLEGQLIAAGALRRSRRRR